MAGKGEVFLFSMSSGPDLWLTQPIQCAPAFFLGVKTAEETIL
jgi:hypothetical protein